jgi:hypothetical protein
MNKISLLFLLLIFGLLLSVIAQERLTISVIAEKSEYLLGEPVVVYVMIKNSGNKTLAVSADIAPERDMYIYYITNPEGETKRFAPIFVEEPDEMKKLRRNESVGGSARIFYGGNGYTFPKSGEYQVAVHYQDTKSLHLKIKILEPGNEAEKDQANHILDHSEVGLFMMLEGGDELSDAMAQIESLNANYPDALLTAYVRYALAKNYSVPARNFVSKKPRDANLPKSIEILESLKSKEIQLYYRNKVFNTLSSNLEMVGRKEDAQNVKGEFRKIMETKENMQPFFSE